MVERSIGLRRRCRGERVGKHERPFLRPSVVGEKIVRGIVTTVLILGLVGGGLFLYNQSTSTDPATDSIAQSQSPVNNVPPAATPPSTTVPLDTTRQPAAPPRTEVAKKNPAQKPPTEQKIPAEETKKESTSSVRTDSVKSAFVPAEPIDGYPALYDYFSKELRYPEDALKDSIQGVTSVTFIINAQGKPEHVSTDRALPEAFDKEAR